MDERKDIASLYYGPVILYHDKDLWNSDNDWFKENSFSVITIDAATWATIDDIYSDLQEKLEFPSYFGRNLDAVVDCLRDLDYSGSKGVLISFENYEEWNSINRITARELLDIFATVSYEHLVGGKKLIVHIQSNDPRLRFDPIASRDVSWNEKERIKR